jgi:lipid-binding SYLF domain-containing protein
VIDDDASHGSRRHQTAQGTLVMTPRLSIQSSVSGTFAAMLLAVAGFVCPLVAQATEPSLEQESRAALKSLYESSPVASSLGKDAKAILVFPNVTKAGFIVGGQGGNGVLLINNKVIDNYNTAAVSVGMQAGAQTFGYTLFFMSDKVLKEFRDSKNFQIGVGPSIVVVDAGAGKDLSTLTAKSDVYAMIFDQKGLMAGVGVQGSKITKLDR